MELSQRMCVKLEDRRQYRGKSISPRTNHGNVNYHVNRYQVSTSSCSQGPLKSHPSDCRRYFRCTFGYYTEMLCPNGLNWNPQMKYCDSAYHCWSIGEYRPQAHSYNYNVCINQSFQFKLYNLQQRVPAWSSSGNQNNRGAVARCSNDRWQRRFYNWHNECSPPPQSGFRTDRRTPQYHEYNGVKTIQRPAQNPPAKGSYEPSSGTQWKPTYRPVSYPRKTHYPSKSISTLSFGSNLSNLS